MVERRQHAVRAEGDVVLLRGDDRIAAQQLSLFLAADDETPRAVEAKWQVEGRIAQRDDVGARADFDFRSKLATIDFDGSPAQPTRIALESERGDQVLLSAPGPDGLRREIAARYLVATLVGGRLTTAQGFQPVYFSEHPAATPDKPLRTGQADQVEAEFDAAGRPTKLTFVGRVSFRDARIEGKGERGFFDLERGRAELFGKRVQVDQRPRRADRSSPHLGPHAPGWSRPTAASRRGSTRSRRACSPVRRPALADRCGSRRRRRSSRSARAASSSGARSRPGRARACCSPTSCAARKSEQRLSAAGGVKTIWREVAGGRRRRAVQTEITAETLAYRRAERTVTYAGERPHAPGRADSGRRRAGGLARARMRE